MGCVIGNDYDFMFNATSFNQPIGDWDVSLVTEMKADVLEMPLPSHQQRQNSSGYFLSNKNWTYDWSEFVEKDTKKDDPDDSQSEPKDDHRLVRTTPRRENKDEQKVQDPPATDNKGATDEKGKHSSLPDQEKPEDKKDKIDKQPNENFVPIVRTLIVRENKAGSLVFGGRIMTDGGSEIKKAGIEISQSLRFEKSSRKTAEVKGKKFELEIDQLEPGTRYYYRAFARNEVGEALGSRKAFYRFGQNGGRQFQG